MKTYLADIIPKIQRFSQKLDNLTLLTNQHWVVIDEIANSKNVYIFRDGGELLISQNGKVERARWEYLGHNSLLIDRKDESYLFRHGFFDENILALKVDGKEEYAFLVNETKYDGELNSMESIVDFLTTKYIEPQTRQSIPETYGILIDESIKKGKITKYIHSYKTDRGVLEIEQAYDINGYIVKGEKVFQQGKSAPTGKYKFGFMWYIHIIDGIIENETRF